MSTLRVVTRTCRGGCRGSRAGTVKRWRDGQMALRWCAAGMSEAGKQFRRVNGHAHLPTLRAEFERESVEPLGPSCAMTKGAQPNAHRTATEVPRNLRCVRSIENACFWISHSMCMMRSASCQDLSPVTSRCLDSPCMPARRRCGVSAAVANVWRASWMYGFQGAVARGVPMPSLPGIVERAERELLWPESRSVTSTGQPYCG